MGGGFPGSSGGGLEMYKNARNYGSGSRGYGGGRSTPFGKKFASTKKKKPVQKKLRTQPKGYGNVRSSQGGFTRPKPTRKKATGIRSSINRAKNSTGFRTDIDGSEVEPKPKFRSKYRRKF